MLYFKEDAVLDVVGGFSNTDTIETDVKNTLPDVVLMDIDLPGTDGIQSIYRLRTASGTAQVLMFTVFEDEDKIFSSIKAGANGYLLKKTAPAQIIEAIKDLHAGGSPMSGLIARKILNNIPREKEAKDAAMLTSRETEILSLLVKGNSYKMIAAVFNISPNTVRNHIHNIYEKLHVNSATAAAYKAFSGNAS